MSYDVVILGGGPAGLSAALALGRARKRVLLCDAGPRRNARAVHVHNFVTRDGVTPDEFRGVAREQLAHYPNVVVRDVRVANVTGEKDRFVVTFEGDPSAADPTDSGNTSAADPTDSGNTSAADPADSGNTSAADPADSGKTAAVQARRILVCTGMIDEMLPLDGFAELWGHSIVQCPYCHGWESRDRPWGFLASAAHSAHLTTFALQLRGWTSDVCVLTNAAFELADVTREALVAGGLRVETAPIVRLVARDTQLEAIELADGTRVPCELLFAHPPQSQVPLVRELGLALDDDGFVRVDPMRRETSIPGVFAAGDSTTRMQAAIAAAASGMQAAAVMNVELTLG
jgi:thioredoxin reductase